MKQFPNNLAEAIEWLSSFGAVSEGGVTRTLYSKPWKEAQQALREWMELLGLDTKFDSIGNLFGQLSTTNSGAPTILVGSHVDTVISGGKYDGAYGIVAAILALSHLKKEYGQPLLNLEVVSLCEEEGSRFPIACSGSGVMTGVYSFDEIKGVTDSDGLSFEAAMKEAGFGLEGKEYKVRHDIHAFIELHIEQGPSLERLGKSIGIVQTIVGQKRFRIKVTGESNHAGTTLMKWRKDPLHGAVSMIDDLYLSIKDFDENLVTTVGQLIVEPNVSNVIPSQIVFTVDARHPLESILSSFCDRFTSRFQEVAERKGLGITIEKWHEIRPVQMDPSLNDRVQKICTKSDFTYHVMNSGAGHDAQLFAQVCPTTIMFVPSQGGISHSPLEYTSTADLETGLDVLIQLLHQLAYR
ncbi:Zn-dependent hydrolase [Bacillus sp. MM2020_1]|nr:Zn-dependent hydrolase [Bacillus sp. MM2020_1]